MDGFIGWTSRIESKKLLEEGLNPNTADMYYLEEEGFPKPIPYESKNLEEYLNRLPFWTREHATVSKKLPCWSLGRLINIMPSKIKNANLELFTNTEEIEKQLGKNEYGEFFITVHHIFYNVEYNPNQFRVSDIGFTEDRLIDGVINMILYLLQENIIKKVDVKEIFKIKNLNEL